MKKDFQVVAVLRNLKKAGLNHRAPAGIRALVVSPGFLPAGFTALAAAHRGEGIGCAHWAALLPGLARGRTCGPRGATAATAAEPLPPLGRRSGVNRPRR